MPPRPPQRNPFAGNDLRLILRSGVFFLFFWELLGANLRLNGIRNNNTASRGNNMSYYPQTIANKMEKGLTKEIEMYAAISKALREDGNSKSQVSYYMSVDEDFIPDVLQAYASVVTAPISYCQCEACTA